MYLSRNYVKGKSANVIFSNSCKHEISIFHNTIPKCDRLQSQFIIYIKYQISISKHVIKCLQEFSL